MRVAVLSGGRSSEHPVSLDSGASVVEGLTAAGHDVVAVTLERDGSWWSDGAEVELRAGRGLLGADAVFPVLHGPFGEDGTVQGLLEILDVPYVGAGVLASAICMDKVVFKDLMTQAGVPQVDYVAAWPDQREVDLERLGLPCWVKPARLGSSVGIARVSSPDELGPALDNAFAHDPHVIVESALAQAPLAEGARAPYFVGVKMHDNDFFAEDSAWLTVYLNGGRRTPPWNTALRSPLLSAAQMAARWALWEGTVREVAARRLPVVNLLGLQSMLRT